jgi:hypothetical protein
MEWAKAYYVLECDEVARYLIGRIREPELERERTDWLNRIRKQQERRIELGVDGLQTAR